MKVEELKKRIESEKWDNYPIIMTDISNCEFLVHQYIHKIISKNNLTAFVAESISDIPARDNKLFNSLENNYFYIYYTDVENELRRISLLRNCCIVYTGKKLKDVLDIEEYIVEIPKIEKWQIRDYVCTRIGEVDNKDIDYLIDISGGDLFKLEKEVDKIVIFDEKCRGEILKKFIKDSIFDDSNTFNIFNLVEAVLQRRPEEAYHTYNRLISQGVNVFGVINLLYTNFRNVIKIQLSPNPSPETTGLKANQYWAVKKNNIGFYHKQELLYIFGLLTDIDRRIKTGEISVNESLEYLLLNILKL